MSETQLGTPERRWRHEPAVAEAPEMDWGAPGRVVVVAPHPDDETLAIGGSISMLARRGFTIDIVAVTDGEGSHPKSPTVLPEALGKRRAQEQLTALGLLGVQPDHVHRLHISDGRVARSDLRSQLARLVKDAALVLAPFERDGHPDHDAAGQAARAVHPRVLAYLVWAWHWGTPGNDALPWHRFRRVNLDSEARRAKAEAITRFHSQISPLSAFAGDEPVLPAAVLDRFARPFETVLVP